ncbi:MAG: leucyl aminopeptidase family protein [Deltaproteobacteria bacterium]|nr:MAG: leucyl aminopeptidase family protein [Deltaproteobacteria bacterium]
MEYLSAKKTGSTPIHLVEKKSFGRFLARQSPLLRNWAAANAFEGQAGKRLLVPTRSGKLDAVVIGARGNDPWDFAPLPAALPAGDYHLAGRLSPGLGENAALGWALGTYRFTKYKKDERRYATLGWPRSVDREKVTRLFTGICLTRDLITTPANDMGPEELAAAALTLAETHGAEVTMTVGDDLLTEKLPAIHAVGRASVRAPRLIDLRWGDPKKPKLTLVGKGVCFDTGGLDLKGAANMKMMKKDMGGAALVLGLAHAIMDSGLPVRLRVLVPAVENSVAGNAYRPLDVIDTRKGKTVEVGNTDAEGRIVLSDALTLADEERPDLIIDAATLTGAARVALGTKLPALFSSDDKVAEDILSSGVAVGDPLWRMPLHEPYRRHLDSPVADLNNIANIPFGGAITAALFLREFVSKKRSWVHIDTMGYNTGSAAGRPAGGEAMGLRALYAMLEKRYRRRRRR